MANTNKAEELVNKIKKHISDEVCMGTFGLVELELRDLIKSRQSEIDELTKEVERLRNIIVKTASKLPPINP